jgi:uncharacterized membrane protein YdjX (TVP38/TMEM64 family)
MTIQRGRMFSRPKVYRILLPAMLLGMLAVLVHSQSDMAGLRTWLDSSGPLAPILFISIGILLMSAFVPKTVMSIMAGALFGTGLGSGLMLVVAVVAALVNYHIGRWWMKRPDPQMSDQQTADPAGPESQSLSKQDLVVQSISRMAAEAGFGAHLLVRLLPVPTTVISYGMGAAQARLRPYLIAAAVAVIPQTLWVHSGTAATLVGETSTTTAQWVSIAMAIVGGLLIAVIIPQRVLRQIRQNQLRQSSNSTIGAASV